VTVTVTVFPDVEILVIAYLKAKMNRRVVTDLPAGDALAAALPIFRVARVSGEDQDYKLDRPIIDVDVFAATRSDASTLSRQAQTWLRQHLPYEDSVQPTGVVTSVDTVVGPRWLPDTNTNLRRFGASYEVTLHA
jgi:hypothetical protein